ncbi:ricin-type beta-trefoil lectin domain protein [Streptomyces sp. NPDC001536]|uniref:GH12 family glycosyl hydrolase domain-containing protein n=1 Tax=Streptomyces sp. NPDC001536 TaxID=3364583 RepID=UPI0036829C98
MTHFAVLALLAGCSGHTPAPAAKRTPSPASTTAAPATTATGPATVCTSAEKPYPQRLVKGDKYSIEPNRWNASGGTICLKTPGDTGFTVSDVHGLVAKDAKAPRAYPNIATVPGTAGLPVPVTDLGDATSDWAAWPAASGSYNLAYDLWYGPSRTDCDSAHSAELMIWLDATDNIAPAGRRTPGTVDIGGDTYAVYEAPVTGAHSVISYVRTHPTRTVRGLNLRLFTADALQRGYIPEQSYLCKVAAGFEIWTGGVGLRTFDFAFHNRTGLPTGVVRSGATGICLRSDDETAVTGSCGGSAGKTTWTVANDGHLRTGGRCLQSAGTTKVTLAACAGKPAQRWAPGPDDRLVHTASGRCLDTDEGSLAVGVTAVLRPCHEGTSQRWSLPHNGLTS